MADEARRARLGELADEIEAEMRRLGVWFDDPPGEDRVLEGGAFGMGTVAFEQWIQVVFLARLRQVAAGEIPIPTDSSVGTFAVREWDTAGYDTSSLRELIHKVDRVVNYPEESADEGR
jgi:uncharacterized protein YqcC (DUF446 family)